MTIAYDHAAIEGFISQANTYVADLQTKREELGKEIGNLTGGWEGGAAGHMNDAFHKMGTDINTLHDILNAVHAAVQQGSNDMQHLDGQLAGGWANAI